MSKVAKTLDLLNRVISREKGVSWYEGYFDGVEEFNLEKERGPKPEKGYPDSIDDDYEKLWNMIKELGDEKL